MNFRFQLGSFEGVRLNSVLLAKGVSKSLSLSLALLLGTGIALLNSSKAFAVEQITVKYGALDIALPMSDLQSFAQTGKPSSQLQSVLNLAKQDPESVRSMLTREVSLDSQLVMRLLNTYFGEIMLKQMAEVAYPPVTRAQGSLVLRDALVASARDNKISLIEVLQNYTPQALEVDGNQALAIYERVIKDAQDLQAIYQNSPALQNTARQAADTAKQVICEPGQSGSTK
ncbi:alpha/beta hydrolase [Kamptonema sp. UHCC 0994]|uniref:alpha/beta hydrolase n=1 Tax=Kamptonema sp. UHCC 0994 TaxID=3031329 RepID=UPI0023B8ECA5|nr:alpha/beta hydrolase [Kamptonema sp. UHCC 0994]MDF0554988.1 alpha/beta hydrolase [Kamptonema sp. UHCC 0994]